MAGCLALPQLSSASDYDEIRSRFHDQQTDIREALPEVGDALRRGFNNLFGGDEETVPTAPRAAAPAPMDAGPRQSSFCAGSELDPTALFELQVLLNTIWGSPAAGAGQPDGVCGPRTIRAIEALQRAHGLTPDGVPSVEVLALAREITGSLRGAESPSVTSSPAPAAVAVVEPPSEAARMPNEEAVPAAAASASPVDGGLSSAVESQLVAASTASCQRTQQADPTNEGFDQAQIEQYCRCIAVATADVMTEDDLQEMARTRQATARVRAHVQGEQARCALEAL